MRMSSTMICIDPEKQKKQLSVDIEFMTEPRDDFSLGSIENDKTAFQTSSRNWASKPWPLIQFLCSLVKKWEKASLQVSFTNSAKSDRKHKSNWLAYFRKHFCEPDLNTGFHSHIFEGHCLSRQEKDNIVLTLSSNNKYFLFNRNSS